MRDCDHDRVYSGQINLSNRYACICRHCGEHWWTEAYDLSRVNLDEYLQLRVQHGWATRLPAPPPVPTNMTPPEPPAWPFVPGTIFFTFLAVACAAAAIPWGALGPIMPLWMSMLGSGLGLGTATVCYVAWKRGL